MCFRMRHEMWPHTLSHISWGVWWISTGDKEERQRHIRPQPKLQAVSEWTPCGQFPKLPPTLAGCSLTEVSLQLWPRKSFNLQAALNKAICSLRRFSKFYLGVFVNMGNSTETASMVGVGYYTFLGWIQHWTRKGAEHLLAIVSLGRFWHILLLMEDALIPFSSLQMSGCVTAPIHFLVPYSH